MTLLFLSHFSKVQDERFSDFLTYPLDELLFSTLMGLMCGADDWEDIVAFGDDQPDAAPAATNCCATP
jgi:DDE_Tnp_1-associated